MVFVFFLCDLELQPALAHHIERFRQVGGLIQFAVFGR
jgi:hypothetical protein